MTSDIIGDALDKLRGAVTIVYPMGLPSYDPIRKEFEGSEELAGTQAELLVMEESVAQLWWAGKELARGKKLQDYIGKNEKTKIIAKLQKVCRFFATLLYSAGTYVYMYDFQSENNEYWHNKVFNTCEFVSTKILCVCVCVCVCLVLSTPPLCGQLCCLSFYTIVYYSIV